MKLIPIRFSLGQFLLRTPGSEGKDKGVDEDVWGVSTPQCCHHLFGVQSKPVPVEGQPRSHNSPTQSLGRHFRELVANRGGIVTATNPGQARVGSPSRSEEVEE